MTVFDVGIAAIFAREGLEGAVIVSNYRTVIQKNEETSDETKKQQLRAVTHSACIATLVAVILVIAVTIPLAVLNRDFNDRSVTIIEGVSKTIASFFILQFSLKIPVWLGMYEKVPLFGIKKWIATYICKKRSEEAEEDELKAESTLTLSEIRFNVMWNLWREVAECGVFLIPYILGTGAEAIPVSGIVGIAVALLLAMVIHVANNRMKNRFWLAFFMTGLVLMLAVGLFVGGVHEFEELKEHEEEEEEESNTSEGDASTAEEESEGGSGDPSNVVYTINGSFWDDENFPMVLLKPFGYSSTRTVAQITSFWSFLAFGLILHFIKYRRTRDIRKRRQAMQEMNAKLGEETDNDAVESSSDEGPSAKPVSDQV